MQSRRIFLGRIGVTSTLFTTAMLARARSTALSKEVEPAERADWLRVLRKVAGPVLENLATHQLKQRMPVEGVSGQKVNRTAVTHLEAVGRTLAGIAPWLELKSKSTEEEDLRRRWVKLAHKGLANATDPTSPDYLDFTAGPQCLVDAAFLACALLRAPQALWASLDAQVQNRLLESLRATRQFSPGNNNWLLFSAMIETFLAHAKSDWKREPIDHALRAHEQWYLGDGLYGDGPEFHWDYYNSFVIQPFLIDLLECLGPFEAPWAAWLDRARQRARRYAVIQERLIAPDGSYPIIGRSIAYRCGAFHLLAQTALRRQLPPELPPSQVRGGLSAVIRRTLTAPETFDPQGWLQIGVAGHQPALGEPYISTGSLYLCTFAFLPLGLPANDPFWTGPDTEWTSRKIWAGQNLPADHAFSHKS